MALFKKHGNAPSWTAKAFPIGAGIAALGGLAVAYLRWFRPGADPGLTGKGGADIRSPSAPAESPAETLAGRFHGLDGQHAATHFPPSLERDPKNIERSIHEG